MEKITLIGTDGTVLEPPSPPVLPPSGEGTRIVFEYPLPDDFTLERIVADRGRDSSGSSEYSPLSRIGFRPAGRGITFGETAVTVAAGYGLSWSDGELTLTLPEAGPAAVRTAERAVKFTYERASSSGADAGESERIQAAVADSTGERTAVLTPRKGKNSLFFHPAVWGGTFDSITLRGISGRLDPVRFTLEPVPDSPDRPIGLDGGSILRFDISEWRREEFELYRWNLFPSILIFDTRDYAVQAGLFKRLAFFVEKRGYIGRLLDDTELEGKHGWNAHDYRAVDLAAFFQAAEDRHFELGESESLLRDILLADGIIRFDGGMYLPGEGGVISLSRESSEYLRRKFMIHEGYHGAFFASGEFRDRSFELFAARPEEERRFWSDFFGLMGYGVDNRYLLVNEYQAYLLQQPVDEAEGYFRSHWAYRRLAGGGGLFPDDIFAAAAREMELTVQRLFGLSAGELFCLDGFTE